MRKPVKQICTICNEEFMSSTLKKTCSDECKQKIRSIAAYERYKDHRLIIECKHCGEKVITTIVHTNKHFCSKLCYDEWQKEDGEEQLIIREKYASKFRGKSLRERGFSEESIKAWVNAGVSASAQKTKGKTVEEIRGEERGKAFRALKKEQTKGTKNPFYGKHHTIETKNKIIKNRKLEGYIYSSGYFNNIYWQSSYELAYLVYCHTHNVNVKRYDLDPIEYIYKNEKHHYYPDFISNSMIIECKGYRNSKVDAKIKKGKEILKEKYVVLNSNEINNLGFNIPYDRIWYWYIEMLKKYPKLLQINYTPYDIVKEFLNENKS